MKNRVLGIVTALFALSFAACGSSPPPPVEPVITPVQTCTAEQWVHMPYLVQFPTAGSEIDFQQREILQELVASAQQRQDLRRVRVEGHTDTCGNELNNMVLSQNRATSVANELVAMGVPRDSVDTIGYGSTQPRANESCSRGANQDLSEQTNRRVEFSLLVCR